MNSIITRRTSLLSLGAALGAAALAPGVAQALPSGGGQFERDREAILAMAGDFRVRFDFRETVPFLDDYNPLEPKVSGGDESVRVAEDSGRVIRLQHLLVVSHEGQTMVIKHWRQDWEYEPRQVLVYAGANRWRLRALSRAERDGAWAQTVWQTDDSPRYGGVGRWAYEDGVTRWTSDETLRPLARRDAIRNPPYDRMRGVNRHALTPTGWVHEQDNAKIGARDGQSVTFTHEIVLNTYNRSSDYEIAAADRYWAATQAYWAAIRGAWDQTIMRGRGVAVAEEAETGAATAPPLMRLADRIATGEITTDAAVSEGLVLIQALASA